MNYLIHNISINLNRIRKAKGMRLDVVAEQTGMSKSMLAGIERGTANPSIGVIDKILSGLRIELADLTQAPVKDAYLVNVENIAPTKDVPGDIIPLIAIPTTAGTGKYRKIYNYISPTPAADDFEPIELVSLLRELNAELGIPASLKETGVTPDKFDAMADDAMKSGNIAVNPRATTKKDVLALYEKTL